jgi:hypothetical protein
VTKSNKKKPAKAGKIVQVTKRTLRKNTDFDKWLDEHVVDPFSDQWLDEPNGKPLVFYMVTYDRGYLTRDSREIIEAGPAFFSEADAHTCAYELSRGNMPRAVLRCEIVAEAPAHDK